MSGEQREKPTPETPAQQQMRRDGKVAKDELDKATKDPGRLGNKGRGSR